MRILVKIIFTFFGLFMLAQMFGCAAVNTYPMKARSGETITIAVGSPDGMTTENTTITYTPDATGSPIDITADVVAIFDLFPDKGSDAWLKSDAGALSALAGHSPWQTIVAVDLPLGLPEGMGVVNVNTTAGYPSNSLNPHINTVNIALEILAGSGEANPFDYAFNYGTPGDLTLLEPMGHFVVSGPDNGYSYGAVEIKLNLPDSRYIFNNANNPMYLIYDERPQHGHNPVQYGWYIEGDDVTVFLMEPGGGLRDDDVRFRVIPDIATGQVTSVTYYDVDGVPVSGPALSVTHRP